MCGILKGPIISSPMIPIQIFTQNWCWKCETLEAYGFSSLLLLWKLITSCLVNETVSVNDIDEWKLGAVTLFQQLLTKRYSNWSFMRLQMVNQLQVKWMQFISIENTPNCSRRVNIIVTQPSHTGSRIVFYNIKTLLLMV